MEKNVRLRILLVMELFFERTDLEHGVSMGEIIHYLEGNNISGERKSVYEDIHALQEYGLAIEYFSEDKTYRLTERVLEMAELKLLVDAVHASKFISKQRADVMVEKITEMAGCYRRGELKREIFSEKPKAQNSVGFYSMDLLHEAMTKDCQVTFQYLEWSKEKKLVYKHDGARYTVSPWLMVWADENYYLVAYDKMAKKLKHYRVDKISDVVLTEEAREGEMDFKKTDITKYSTNHFGMFSGDHRRVSMTFDNALIGVVLDRFGTDMQIQKEDNNHFKTALPVVVSAQFFGWVAALGDKACIVTQEVAEEFQSYLKKTLAIYTDEK